MFVFCFLLFLPAGTEATRVLLPPPPCMRVHVCVHACACVHAGLARTLCPHPSTVLLAPTPVLVSGHSSFNLEDTG